MNALARCQCEGRGVLFRIAECVQERPGAAAISDFERRRGTFDVEPGTGGFLEQRAARADGDSTFEFPRHRVDHQPLDERDRIIGVQEPGRGIIIHTIDCERLESYESSDAAWVDLSWTQAALDRTLSVGRLVATVENSRGVLAELCKIVAENEGDILNLRMSKRTADFFDMIFDIEVADAQHLVNILAAMRTSRPRERT